MKKIVTLFFFLTFIGYSQITITLPENPVYDTIQKSWRGYNHSSNSNLTLFENQMFRDSFPQLHPGIIRWPGGNISQDYNWLEHLNVSGKFNLKNVIPYLETYGADLQIVANFGTSNAAETAEFVKFCNSTDSYYADLRANLLGNSAPIQVKYWEIGNESNTRWAFGWSWLGYQNFINFRTGEAPKPLTHEEIDRLYYYGGSFFREGWVPIIGGLDLETAILGDLLFYNNAKTTDIVSVKFPKLDISDSNSVRVYRTPNFDFNWAHSLGTSPADVQALYNSLTNPSNLLSTSEFSWDETQVTLSPNGGIQANDAVLIEYNSVEHDGAFAYRNAMKLADPTIEIGYVVALKPELYEDPVFQQDFATSPPDFMVVHSYPGSETQPLAEHGYFSEEVYVAEKEINSLIEYQNLWNQRVASWGISNSVGVAVTEWNINLYDAAPDNHPHKGISSGVYVASFWGNLFEKSIRKDIDLRANNHFALIASGSNFIHLFHSNTTLNTSVEGKATRMVMETIGTYPFALDGTNLPQIQILSNDLVSTLSINAIEKWGGISTDGSYANVLLINRDDTQSYQVNLEIPSSYLADTIRVKKLYGTMIDQYISTTTEEQVLTNNTYTLNIPAFSVTSVKIHVQKDLRNTTSLSSLFHLFPNPTSTVLNVQTTQENYEITVFDILGRTVKKFSRNNSTSIEVTDLKKGLYFFKMQTNNTCETHKIVVN